MKKLVLLVLLSVMSVGMVAESSHAFIFGGAWRRHYRKHGAGFFKGRSASVEKRGPYELEHVRVAVDSEIKCLKFCKKFEGLLSDEDEDDDPFREYK